MPEKSTMDKKKEKQELVMFFNMKRYIVLT